MHWKYIGSDFEYLPVRADRKFDFRVEIGRKTEVGSSKLEEENIHLFSFYFGLLNSDFGQKMIFIET